MLLADTNGDILFTQSLTVTLRLVRERLGTQTGAGGLFGKRLLIVGRRTDFTFSRWARNLSSSDSCELSRTLVHVAKEGEMMLPCGPMLPPIRCSFPNACTGAVGRAEVGCWFSAAAIV